MTIYLNPKKTDRLEQYVQTTQIPAHEKIGAVFAQTLEAIRAGEQEKAAKLLSYLHVADGDKAAQETMLSLIQTLSEGSLRIVNATTGTYFLQKPVEDKKGKFENVAVFKIGRKRAAIETMARHFAHTLGLSKQMISGMFCAVMNIPIMYPDSMDAEETQEDVEDTVEELWNGKEKVYLPPPEKITASETESWESSEEERPAQKTAEAVVGIIQPFLKKEPTASLLDYTKMTIFALAVGLRDGNNFEGSKFFDVEDCMPIRIDPPLTPGEIEKSPSAIDLPYLDKDPRTTEKLSPEEIGELYRLVRQWDILSIISNLKHLKIHYEDREAEELLPDSEGVDEGGHHIKVEKPLLPHLINGELNHLLPTNAKRRILLPDQLNACNTRLQRIRDYITHSARNNRTFTPQELVYAVDLWGELYHKVIQTSELPKKYERSLKMSGMNSISGRTSPNALGVFLPELDSHYISPASNLLERLEQLSKENEEPDS